VAMLRRSSLIFLSALLCIAGCVGLGFLAKAAEQEQSSPPRTLMRLPRWIESLSEQSTRKPLRPLPAVVTDLPATVASPLVSDPWAPAVPRKPLEDRATLTGGWNDLVSQASDDSQALTLTTPIAPAIPAEMSERAPPRQTLGPETSVLKRQPTERLAEVSQPLPAATTKPATASQTPATIPLSQTPPLPEQSVTEQSVTEQTAPEQTAPEQTAPEQTAPEQTAPEQTAPEQTAPEQEVPEQEVPEQEVATPSPTAVSIPAAPSETPTLSIDPASFRGVYPGKTSRNELEKSWEAGEAFTREDGSKGFFWKIEPFERVEVMLDGDTVESIRIQLTNPVAISELAAQLEIADLRTVSILNEEGVSVGEVFPERGVVFSLNPGTHSATAVMLEPLDPESFVLRAEGEIDTSSLYAIADLEYAIEIDPQHLRAHRLLLVLMCEQGRWLQALTLAQTATKLDPVDIWTRLKMAGVLLALDRGEEARKQVDFVKEQEHLPPLVVAQVERMLGRIDLVIKSPNYHTSVEHFGEAIRKAMPLIAARSESVQKAARDVLLDAHLGTALAIAKGTWQQKGRVIPKWIARSETFISDLPPDHADKEKLELQLCRGALAASAGSADSIDALPWVKRLLMSRDRMDEKVVDPLRRRQIDWEVGQGLADALVAAQKRGDSADMLDNATLTAAYLERGAEQRELSANEKRNIGDLMFRVGILHSLQKGDHATAVIWFDKTVPLWEKNLSFEKDGQSGRLGESFVSMAISYWQMDRREDAVSISRKGVDLMVKAIDDNQLDERSLSVAYGNLATMYAEEGDEEKAQTYAEMASRAEATGTVSGKLQR